MKINLAQEELSISKILTESWTLYKTLFQRITLITLIVYIPINIMLFYLPTGDTWESVSANLRAAEFIQTFFGVLATMAIALVVQKHLDGEELSSTQALGQSFSRWPAAIWTGFLAGLFIIGLVLLLVVPAIIYGGYWSFMIYCVILSQKSGMDALRYSKRIVQKRWWKILWYSVIFAVLAFLVAMVGGLPLFILPPGIWTTLIINSFTDILISYFSVVFTLFYLNFEATRKVENPELSVPVPQNPQ